MDWYMGNILRDGKCKLCENLRDADEEKHTWLDGGGISTSNKQSDAFDISFCLKTTEFSRVETPIFYMDGVSLFRKNMWKFESHIPINFCPMCGKDLREVVKMKEVV